ncbi:PREDICTED: leukemia-associated protein 7 [Nanorana parkeri]|uniref:leukemia-associated protein 7 n=1 Tax=Nanorana parkeri TaxID=125878 RepID=UPI000854DE53|nr:PREDICTED: leukemia-associated protein 7 [Nanorana parkeri]
MPLPAVLRDVVSHQAKALNTLLPLLEQRGMHCGIPNLFIAEGATISGLCHPQVQQAGTELPSDDTDSGSSPRCLTLAQRASRHRLSRVARSILELLLVEENMLQHLPLDHQFTMQIKDSVEFRNICTHMALQTEDRRFDQDLNSAQECLTQIISNMTWDTSSKTCDFCHSAQEQLKRILQKLHED